MDFELSRIEKPDSARSFWLLKRKIHAEVALVLDFRSAGHRYRDLSVIATTEHQHGTSHAQEHCCGYVEERTQLARLGFADLALSGQHFRRDAF